MDATSFRDDRRRFLASTRKLVERVRVALASKLAAPKADAGKKAGQ
jgi:hypothetical protein